MTGPSTAVGNADALADCIVGAFMAYNHEFRNITRQAKETFETRDWLTMRHDAVARIELYDLRVRLTVEDMAQRLGDDGHDKALWAAIKNSYAEKIREYPDEAFFKTFFSSVTRQLFQTIGVDPRIEFTAFDIAPPEHEPLSRGVRSYRNRGAVRLLVDQILSDFNFAAAYRDRDRTVRFVAAEIEAYCASLGPKQQVVAVDMLTSVFYRSTRAFLVGCIEGSGFVAPFLVAMRNTDDGIVADTVILTENEASMIFGYTRSYFHADIDNVSATVAFLRRFLPHKPLAELYTVLGRAKQGKTERYRAFFQHLESSADLFVHALGDKGMVMEVFTLPSADIVFKIIRDRFAYPKTMGRKDVMEKYELVFKHDRAGRLVDAQEFKRLRFPVERFEPRLLDNLLEGCKASCRIEADDLVVEHCYVERRLTPLNLYLEDASETEARAAAVEYGQAIRDLAMSNIFAGDLLLKNFGVSRHGRVIFYDYDELCLVTECNFRRLPEPRDDMDEMRAGAWFYVGPNDVFPEQFIEFLGFRNPARQAFLDFHADLLTPAFWSRLKRRFERGEVIDVLPYANRDWTEHRGTLLVPARNQPSGLPG
ncbi:MAG: bifunctional isocitrate dehydrogenase kinase/phosphatase [Pseudomonadota bacterium]